MLDGLPRIDLVGAPTPLEPMSSHRDLCGPSATLRQTRRLHAARVRRQQGPQSRILARRSACARERRARHRGWPCVQPMPARRGRGGKDRSRHPRSVCGRRIAAVARQCPFDRAHGRARSAGSVRSANKNAGSSPNRPSRSSNEQAVALTSSAIRWSAPWDTSAPLRNWPGRQLRSAWPSGISCFRVRWA